MAFIPQGNTSLIKATTTASAAQQPSTGSVQGFRLYAASTALCLYAIGVSTATAALPTTGTAAAGIPLPGNTPIDVQAPPNGWISVITSTAGGTADVYVTPGTVA
jgi:hypothetical protein